MRALSLFSGMGGFDLGFELAGIEIVGQVEIDKYCLKILEHHFPNAKRWGDITTVSGAEVLDRCGAVDVVCGGFPCQDISTAGKGAGLEGERSGLWWHMRRIIEEVRPTWIVIENVDALRVRGLDRVVSSLESMDYQVWCHGISAESVGAPHIRKRLFILAYSDSARLREQSRRIRRQGRKDKAKLIDAGDVGNTHSITQREQADQTNTITVSGQTRGESEHASNDELGDTDSGRQPELSISKEQGLFTFPGYRGQEQYHWEKPRTIESAMGATADGLPRKLALRAIGNAVVPAIPFAAARTIQRMQRLLDGTIRSIRICALEP